MHNAIVLMTHTGSPMRNEKYLASLASGKWVLHKSYLEACREQEKFVQVKVNKCGLV